MSEKDAGNATTPAEKLDQLASAWAAFQEEHAKGEKADQDKLERIQSSLDGFEEFKQAELKRIKEAEAAEEAAKTAEEARQQRIEELGGSVKELTETTARIETALKRPGAGAEADSVSEKRVSWNRFLRFGEKGVSPRGVLKDAVGPDEIKASLVSSDDTGGGYLAPPEYFAELIKEVTEISPFRTLARVFSTTRQSIQVPKRTAQFSASWQAEQESGSEATGLTYGLQEIPTHMLRAIVDMSHELMEDAVVDMESELSMEFAERFALAEGTAFVTGNAVGRPEGILDNTDIAETVSGSASTIAYTDGQANGLIDLFYAIKTAYSRNATWVLNRTTLGAARKLKDADNNYIWQPGLAMGIPNTILGAPYVEMPDMPDEAANAYPIAFGDFRRAYYIVDRVNMSVLRDPFTQATSGAVRFVARRRVGGQVVLAEAIRKLKCST